MKGCGPGRPGRGWWVREASERLWPREARERLWAREANERLVGQGS